MDSYVRPEPDSSVLVDHGAHDLIADKGTKGSLCRGTPRERKESRDFESQNLRNSTSPYELRISRSNTTPSSVCMSARLTTGKRSNPALPIRSRARWTDWSE